MIASSWFLVSDGDGADVAVPEVDEDLGGAVLAGDVGDVAQGVVETEMGVVFVQAAATGPVPVGVSTMRKYQRDGATHW